MFRHNCGRHPLTLFLVVSRPHLSYAQAQSRAPHLCLGQDCPYWRKGNASLSSTSTTSVLADVRGRSLTLPFSLANRSGRRSTRPSIAFTPCYASSASRELARANLPLASIDASARTRSISRQFAVEAVLEGWKTSTGAKRGDADVVHVGCSTRSAPYSLLRRDCSNAFASRIPSISSST
jgi:hypothetical protein